MRNKKFCLVGLDGGDHSDDLDVDGRIILKCMLRKYSGGMWTGLIWLRIGSVADCCDKYCNELSGSIKDAEFLD
jgi:hypothetical protein